MVMKRDSRVPMTRFENVWRSLGFVVYEGSKRNGKGAAYSFDRDTQGSGVDLILSDT